MPKKGLTYGFRGSTPPHMRKAVKRAAANINQKTGVKVLRGPVPPRKADIRIKASTSREGGKARRAPSSRAEALAKTNVVRVNKSRKIRSGATRKQVAQHELQHALGVEHKQMGLHTTVVTASGAPAAQQVRPGITKKARRIARKTAGYKPKVPASVRRSKRLGRIR